MNEMKQESVNFDQIGTTKYLQLFWTAELAQNLALATKLAKDWIGFDDMLAKVRNDEDVASYDKAYRQCLENFVLTISYKDTTVKINLWNEEHLYDSFMEFLRLHAAEMSSRIADEKEAK